MLEKRTRSSSLTHHSGYSRPAREGEEEEEEAEAAPVDVEEAAALASPAAAARGSAALVFVCACLAAGAGAFPLLLLLFFLSTPACASGDVDGLGFARAPLVAGAAALLAACLAWSAWMQLGHSHCSSSAGRRSSGG